MFGNTENTLWVERYRPQVLADYVGNESLKEKINIYLQNGDVPHLLFYGTAGTGKTTLAKLIANTVDADVMYINASDENNVDVVREKIKNFASTMGFRQWKIIILDESDFMTPNAQAALRNLMETFSTTTRFILTCNYVEKIIDPIQSRCQVFAITPPSKKDVAVRVNQILQQESIQFEMQDLVTIIESGYPDIRRILNSCQRQVINGRLAIDKQSLIEANYMTKILDVLQSDSDKKGKFGNVRQIIADSKVKDYTDLYRFMYDNLDLYATGHIASVILILAEHQSMDANVVNKDINICAMFIKILNEIC